MQVMIILKMHWYHWCYKLSNTLEITLEISEVKNAKYNTL